MTALPTEIMIRSARNQSIVPLEMRAAAPMGRLFNELLRKWLVTLVFEMLELTLNSTVTQLYCIGQFGEQHEKVRLCGVNYG